MSKHTAGPWVVSEGRKLRQEASCGSVPIKSPGNELALCSVATYQRESGEWEANARLIAAAPDLLEACKEAAVMLAAIAEAHHQSPVGPGFNRLMATIAKAEA